MPDTVSFKSIYPFTLELQAEYPLMDENSLAEAMRLSHKAFETWKKTSFSERSEILRHVSAILRRDNEKLATLITKEMGKIIGESRAEVEKCAVTAESYTEHA